MDWLNQRTDTATEFFGVVVEALQIDDSRPACNFRLVASPNEWRKANISGSTHVPSARGEAYQAFFQGLIDRLRTQHNFTQAHKAQPNSWYSFFSGIGGISYGCNFPQGRRTRPEVYIDRQDPAWNKWLFVTLNAQRETIEAAFGEPLEWERTDNRRYSRIAVYRLGSIADPPEVLEEIQSWAIDRLLRFKSVVGPRALAIASAGGPLSTSAGLAETPGAT